MDGAHSSYPAVAPQRSTIRCMATVTEEEDITPLFVGREDGTIEKYVSIADADLGQPSVVLRGHRRAVTGLVATSADEVYSCSLDGTVKIWNADRDLEVTAQRVVRTVDLQAPLYCLALNEGRVYAGGQDGTLKVIDGKRQSSWAGHSDILSCVAFTSTGLAVTGSYDRQLRVWDLSTGKCIRVLTGHLSVVKAVAVVELDEDDGGDGDEAPHTAIVSVGLDRRLLVWSCPTADGLDAEHAHQLAQQTSLDFLERYVGNWQRPGVARQFPDLVAATTDGATNGPFHSGDDEAEDAAGEDSAAPMGGSGVGTEDAAEEEGTGADDAAESRPPSSLTASKDIAVDAPIAVIELLEDPYVADKQGEGFVYLGGTNGSVFGLKLRSLTRKCFADLAERQRTVLAAFRDARVSFKQARTFYEKKYRRENEMEWKRLLRTATRKRNAERRLAKEAADKARAEQRAAAAAARAAAADSGDEDEEDEDDGDEEFIDDDDNEYADEEDGEAEDADGEAEVAAQKQQDMVWQYLGEEEKSRYEALVNHNECQPIVLLKERSALLREHLKAVVPLLTRPYWRSADQFAKLPWVTVAKAGTECVLALVHDEARGKVYASQEARVVPVNISVGVHTL